MWFTFLFLIILVMTVCGALFVYQPEHYYNVLESNKDPSSEPLKASNDINAIIDEKLKIVTTPLITTFNLVVSTLNQVPHKIYDNSMKMSKTIGTKIKQYAESMAPYNRTADDEENLKMIVINKRHKVFIDDLTKNKDMFRLYADFASKFYKIPLEEQDTELLKFLTLLARFNPSIEPLVSSKLQSLS